ncbi:MarR family transcriptional regulator [Gordonia sp. X0973]|uniref:MarR family winged helix-turn-helix transcriptional regulator n=1 Tax=Gordonia sp. X0973 TaxID=2742602 RepID=UPI000F53750A|nr:MarR family transcriptional regulator [Gordonia sp. X0973]QKT07991.1 MarR family transcriptional regulator [Gordonia sp. X0973]
MDQGRGQVDDASTPFLLMVAFRDLVDAVNAALAEVGFPGIRDTHGFAMQAIGPGCTGVELGTRLGVSKQAAAKTADSLESMGLITRERNATDRRERLLVPTERGIEMLTRSGELFRREVGRWRAAVGDAPVDATLATLAAVATPSPPGRPRRRR